MARILLLGQGGREHALAWRLRKNLAADELFCCPGNPGIAELARCVAIPPNATDKLVALAKKLGVSLVIPGPEEPLANGIADEMTANGITCLGPKRAAARLEASKGFARKFCDRHRIPSPWYALCTNQSQLAAAVAAAPTEALAVKADGLCGGKGVFLCHSKAEALKTATPLLGNQAVVLEELLEGEELSFFALVGGGEALPLGAARDYKRLSAAADAPNTGGMGTISAPSLCDRELQRQIMDETVLPVARGLDYCGVLFVGLMLTENGLKVLEYNVRFGDPECQSLMLRLEGDLPQALAAAAHGGNGNNGGELRRQELGLNRNCSACVVIANRGYPGKPTGKAVISNINRLKTDDSLRVFQAGTAIEAGDLTAVGGRVLGVTASANTLDNAISSAYKAVDTLKWSGAVYRSDIGS